MAAAVEAGKAVEKHARGGLLVGSDDAVADGVDGDDVHNDGRADEAVDGGGNDEALGAADRAGCLRGDSDDAGLHYGSQAHACDAPAHVCRPPRHWPKKGKR